MTVDDVDATLLDGGARSDLIAWPSRQFFDPLFCIKELTAGPGCSPEWMRGTDPETDRLYVYVPFVVYAESDAYLGRVPYDLTVESPYSGAVVKAQNASGTVAPGDSRRGYVVVELPEVRAAEEAQPRAFRSLGRVGLEADLTDTIFAREVPVSLHRRYAMPTSTLLPATEQMLEDSQYALDKGMTVASAAESGLTVAAETGSRARGVLVFLYEVAKGQVDTPPSSREGAAVSATLKSLGAFQRLVDRTEGRIDRDIYGDGVVRPVGPTVVRRN